MDYLRKLGRAFWEGLTFQKPESEFDAQAGVPWHPITDPVELKYLIKSVEELGEETSIIARTTIQGWDGIDPKTGKPNIECLEDEIADVEACNELLKKKFNLNRERIEARKKKKMEFLEPLHEAAGKK